MLLRNLLIVLNSNLSLLGVAEAVRIAHLALLDKNALKVSGFCILLCRLSQKSIPVRFKTSSIFYHTPIIKFSFCNLSNLNTVIEDLKMIKFFLSLLKGCKMTG